MLISNRMKWPGLANGSGVFMDLLKVRQLNESGHCLGLPAIERGRTERRGKNDSGQ